MFQNKYGNRLIRLITKIGFRLLTDNRFQIFSDYTTLLTFEFRHGDVYWTIYRYCIQGKFCPHFIFHPFRPLTQGQIQNWANLFIHKVLYNKTGE